MPTLRQIAQSRAAGDPIITMLDNHDLHLLAVAHGIRTSHRSDTIKDILDAPDCIELLGWIRHHTTQTKIQKPKITDQRPVIHLLKIFQPDGASTTASIKRNNRSGARCAPKRQSAHLAST